MILGNVIAIEAELLGEHDIADALVELFRQRAVVAIDVIEDTESH